MMPRLVYTALIAATSLTTAVACGTSSEQLTEGSLCAEQGEVVCSVVFSCLTPSEARDRGFGASASECAQLFVVRNSCDAGAPICGGRDFDPSAAAACLDDIETLGCAGLDSDVSPPSCDFDNFCRGPDTTGALRPIVMTNTRALDGQEELTYIDLDYTGSRLLSMRFTDETGELVEEDTIFYADNGLPVRATADLGSDTLELQWEYDAERRLSVEELTFGTLSNTDQLRYGPNGALQAVTSTTQSGGETFLSTRSLTYDAQGAMSRESEPSTDFERSYEYENERLLEFSETEADLPVRRTVLEYEGPVLRRIVETTFSDDGPPATQTYDLSYDENSYVSSVVWTTTRSDTFLFEIWYEPGELEALRLNVPGLPPVLEELVDLRGRVRTRYATSPRWFTF